MSKVSIKSLSIKRDKEEKLYRDIKLDLSIKKSSNTLQGRSVLKDIEISEDIDAVKNSLFNLFTTIPGQKILNPIYGLNLLQFVFTGITEMNANSMGNLILEGITKFEPRIEVKKIFIFPDIEAQSYEIGLRIDVPTLNIIGVELKGLLSETGFFFN